MILIFVMTRIMAITISAMKTYTDIFISFLLTCNYSGFTESVLPVIPVIMHTVPSAISLPSADNAGQNVPLHFTSPFSKFFIIFVTGTFCPISASIFVMLSFRSCIFLRRTGRVSTRRTHEITANISSCQRNGSGVREMKIETNAPHANQSVVSVSVHDSITMHTVITAIQNQGRLFSIHILISFISGSIPLNHSAVHKNSPESAENVLYSRKHEGLHL